jgi:hypothetical protein
MRISRFLKSNAKIWAGWKNLPVSRTVSDIEGGFDDWTGLTTFPALFFRLDAYGD